MKIIMMVLIILCVSLILTNALLAQSDRDTMKQSGKAVTEFLPIFSYDTDAGVGYGIKSFFLNHLHLRESFDVVLFNSTKGERWYRLVFSIPDFEMRQGTEYPLAIDVVLDYDKWISYSFFGVGNLSRFEDCVHYTREPFEVSITASRGFFPDLVGLVSIRHKVIHDYNFGAESHLVYFPPGLFEPKVVYTSFAASLRYDTRSSYINPSNGVVLLGELEFVPQLFNNNVSFLRVSESFQYYTQLFDNVILTTRTSLQILFGKDLPVQVLPNVGGGTTLRGFPQDRYLDNVATVINAELRFPIIWRFGGVVGFDVGNVFNHILEINADHWAANGVLGLRFYFDTFIVRADVGISKESTNFYLNFGHIF